jgi:hypothetical protein
MPKSDGDGVLVLIHVPRLKIGFKSCADWRYSGATHMNFLRNLFGGGSGSSDDGRSLFVYVRPKRCDQIVEVRIDLMNDLSTTDAGDGFWVRKIAQAIRCPFPAEIVLYFDKSKRITSREITDGEFVESAEYEAWQAQKMGGGS